MATVRLFLALSATAAATLASDTTTIDLITFDGKDPKATHTWSAVNDPVMGGQSHATFKVTNGVGVFSGEVKIVPKLKAPGFCSMQAHKSTFSDASSYTHLFLKVRTSTPDYSGWKVDFGPADHSGSLFFSSYKADFAVKGTNWQTVTIPFTDFSSHWSPYTGEPTTTCAQNSEYCPTAKRLAGITSFEIMAEGAAGNFSLEVERVWAGSSAAPEAAEALVLGAEGSDDCPTVSPIAGLNLTEYARATWFIQKQQETGYQKKEDLFCVTATYNAEGKSVPFSKAKVLTVYNYQNKAEVNGKPGGAVTSGGILLCARVKDPKNPAKLLVAPCFLPNALAGDYWVIAAGPSSERYEWAIVSGGQPKEKHDDGCTTKQTGTNGSGLWFFTRNQVATAAQLAEMEAQLKKLGFTASLLLPVAQEGCEYKDALLIKPDA